MSEFYIGITTIIPLIGFIIKNFNKQYLLNSICLIGSFFLGAILSWKSISFLSFWKFFNIHFILVNLITFLLIYVLYISNKDTKEYMDKQNNVMRICQYTIKK
jgi:hypothetical protein